MSQDITDLNKLHGQSCAYICGLSSTVGERIADSVNMKAADGFYIHHVSQTSATVSDSLWVSVVITFRKASPNHKMSTEALWSEPEERNEQGQRMMRCGCYILIMILLVAFGLAYLQCFPSRETRIGRIRVTIRSNPSIKLPYRNSLM